MPDQPRQNVLELGQFHLHLAVQGMGATGEDVENQLGAVDDLEISQGGDGANLGRREILIENQQRRPLLQGPDDDLLELALPHEVLGVHPSGALNDAVENHHVGSAGQLRQFIEGVLDLLPGFLGNGNENGLLAGIGEIDRLGDLPLQFVIEGTEKNAQIEVEAGKRRERKASRRCAPRAPEEEGGRNELCREGPVA